MKMSLSTYADYPGTWVLYGTHSNNAAILLGQSLNLPQT